MKQVIATQNQENYGAHMWDGKGDCPQNWKFKGGNEYMVEGVPAEVDLVEVVELVRGEIEEHNDFYRVDIIGYQLEADGYMSDFERSQLEYEGHIAYPEPTIQYADIKTVYDYEYSNWSADLDAQAYGELQ